MTDLNNIPKIEASIKPAIDYSCCYAPLSHGSLFSGIGGFDLASEWMGWENLFHCEWNDFGKQVLQYYWPNAKSYDDITKTDFTIWRGKIDVLTGGFPCQPYSVAGKRKGTEDDRHLWPEMLRAIREIQPSWVVGENVSGLINWSGGLVFEEVQTDLENEGYEVWANVLPAASVNAPHKRDRVWFVAYSDHNRKSGRTRENERKSKKEQLQERNQIQFANKSDSLREFPSYASSERCYHGIDNRQERQVYNDKNRYATEDKSERNRRECGISEIGEIRNASNTNSPRLQKTGTEQQTTRIEQYRELDGTSTNAKSERTGKLRNESETERSQNINELSGKQYRVSNEDVADTDSRRQSSKEHRKEEPRLFAETSVPNDWENFPTQSPICDGNDGFPAKLDGISFSKWRNESIKAGGNAIVPQVAFQIFKAINEFHSSGA